MRESSRTFLLTSSALPVLWPRRRCAQEIIVYANLAGST